MYARAIALVMSAFVLAACATPQVMRMFASEPEVIAAYGEPVKRWPNRDGTSTLEYSNQPNGHVTMMYTVDANGAVVHQENALDDENLARVERGMTREQVARMLGQHRSVQTFTLSGEEVWDWNIRNDYGSAAIATLFNVHFIDGKVVRTSRSYIYPRNGDMFGRWWGHPFYDPFPPRFGYHYPLRSRWYRWPFHDPFYGPWYFY